jgi:hypothetical protein
MGWTNLAESWPFLDFEFSFCQILNKNNFTLMLIGRTHLKKIKPVHMCLQWLCQFFGYFLSIPKHTFGGGMV